MCSRISARSCENVNLDADVWIDERQRGALIAFDLGDGWLSTSVFTLDREDQSQLFMREQTFVLAEASVATLGD